MKSYLLQLVERADGQTAKLNLMREYLQVYALRTMFEKGRFSQVAFLGGTALRFLENMPRFSEDLDFSTTVGTGYDFEKILSEIKNEFVAANYSIYIKFNVEKTVHSAFLKFPELMHMAGLSYRADQNITIKIDVDTDPPPGAHLKTTLVNKYFPIAFTHYDLPSLFSGKLHAIFTRPYVKGRDYFDLVWLLSRDRGLKPNFELLNNALKQTKSHLRITVDDWKTKLVERVESVDWEKIVSDVEKFVEEPRHLDSMRLEFLLDLLK